jgi:IclR family transcriptional regulator, KDG regulon repressor
VVADGSTSLRRGLAILTALRSDEALAANGLGVSRIAELVEQDKSQVSRTLRTLDEQGFVERDPDSRAYRLGWALLAAAAHAGDAKLLATGDELVERLSGELGERVHLTVLQGAEVLTVLSASPPHTIQAAGWIGRTTPAYCTSSGHALLFDHTRDELERLFATTDFVRFGPRTPRNIPDLGRRIAGARNRGYALSNEEFEAGLVAAAAPVRDFRGRVVAALNVSAPKFRVGGAALVAAGERVAAAASQLSIDLGYRSAA